MIQKYYKFFKNNCNWLFIFCCLLFFSCSPTKYLKKGELLLNKQEVKCDNEGIDLYSVESLIRQKPVRKTFGVALYSRIYNLVDPAKEPQRKVKEQVKIIKTNKKRSKKYESKTGKYLKIAEKYKRLAKSTLEEGDTIEALRYSALAKHNMEIYNTRLKNKPDEKNKVFTIPNWLQEIGEPPVVYDSLATKRSIRQINLFFRNKGYYDCKVTIQEKIKKKRINIIYNIKAGEPFRVKNINYSIAQENLAKIIYLDTANSLIKTNQHFDIDILENERKRLTNFLKNNGYYKFSKEFIYYQIDTGFSNKKVEITLVIKNNIDQNGKESVHEHYKINNVYVFTDFDPKSALANSDDYYQNSDTSIYYYGIDSIRYHIIKKNKNIVRKQAIAREIYIYPDSTYNLSNIEDTYKHLSSLRIYKLVTIQLKEKDTITKALDCNIQLTPATQQSYTVELQGTNSSGNIGGAGHFNYQHKNLFRGAETFDFRFKVALENQKKFNEKSIQKDFNTQEYGLESRLEFPRLLTPFNIERFTKKFNPKTSLSIGFNYQERPDFTRTVTNTSLGYIWKSSIYVTNLFNLVEFSAVRVSKIDSTFKAFIDTTFLKNSYEDHFIIGSGYTFMFNNQASSAHNYFYFKANGKLAGNLLQLAMKTTNQDTVNGQYVIPGFNTVFAQFAKVDFDFRYYIRVGNKNKLVTRLYAGCGLPYGNLDVLPFGERFFSGGANGIRAWQVRSLGPGGFKPLRKNLIPNQSGDIKLEGNLEYRFKMFWVIEGAYFIDVGNIWDLRRNDDRPDGHFNMSNFYNYLAVGSGFGTRFDFSFFIFRFDFGLKLRDPAREAGKRWIVGNRKFIRNDWTFNLGIGYPF